MRSRRRRQRREGPSHLVKGRSSLHGRVCMRLQGSPRVTVLSGLREPAKNVCYSCRTLGRERPGGANDRFRLKDVKGVWKWDGGQHGSQPAIAVLALCCAAPGGGDAMQDRFKSSSRGLVVLISSAAGATATLSLVRGMTAFNIPEAVCAPSRSSSLAEWRGFARAPPSGQLQGWPRA